ncbi:zinc finger protein 782-like [Patiria miniata]|uniref:C2H2-type domain-containing protein n=1 Tax=Patiria miniata TaxID=46514 RepID=A0A914A4R2_PATMI|nr:zinc finger protein 782-like [Patiria miniata]
MSLRASPRLRALGPKTPLPVVEPSSKKRKKGKKGKKKRKLDKYVCKTCSKEFRRLGRYENHYVLRKFTTLHELRKHQRLTKLAISNGEPNDHVPVKCKLCPFEINSRSEGRQHKRSHSSKRQKQRPYVCSHCKERFSQLTLLGVHERSQHCQTSNTSKDCPKCRHIFRTEADPEQDMPCRLQLIHQIHSYSKTTSVHACHVCGKKFNSSSNLGKHLATHFDFDLHKCDSCRMEFEDEQSLKEHNCSKKLEAPTKPILVVKFVSQPHGGANRAMMVQPVSTSDSTYGETNQPLSLVH